MLDSKSQREKNSIHSNNPCRDASCSCDLERSEQENGTSHILRERSTRTRNESDILWNESQNVHLMMQKERELINFKGGPTVSKNAINKRSCLNIF